ncbi:craniofacial development protein 2-like [Acyrthosiphon pisum]|uniref:Endonuclease/exonuclease/phosphatase domain-containing protein n=1 Tax=Acyrthosiphon pisum TaxID=7029 RepID=A0A8R2B1G2_ACYPI|nr:craniofacial development protein 2-like [Acyrthosiphon pisum]|eukprot:XP_008178936.1 PREDICTED: craniofacial development protein 2-like [Acyrthosiphon pisum]
MTLSGYGSLVLQDTTLNLPRICGALENKTGKRKPGLSFGTWNIRTLFKPGAAQCLVKEIRRYNLGVVALQEIRWNGKGTLDLQDTTIFYGECNDRRQFGTGFAVHKSIVPLVTEFKSTNPRISILTIKGKFFDITFLNGYAPTEEKTPEEKDEFYENLEQTLNEIPRNRIRIVLGDFNAKLGKENIFRSTIGNHSMHDITSENGLRLIDFASGGGLVVKSTMFPRKDIYKGTWKAPNGRYTNQIDHVMINTRFKNCIQEVKTVRGADCDLDHYLVKGKLDVKLKHWELGKVQWWTDMK